MDAFEMAAFQLCTASRYAVQSSTALRADLDVPCRLRLATVEHSDRQAVVSRYRFPVVEIADEDGLEVLAEPELT
ncbi:hypothetical protein [Streptomyces sp. NPDC001020]